MTRNVYLISTLLVTLALTGTYNLAAQQVYLDSGLKRVRPEASVHTVALVMTADGKLQGSVNHEDNTPLMTGFFTPWMNTYIEHGTFTFYHPGGSVESTGQYERGVRVGTWKRYGPDGSPRTDRFYSEEGAATLRKVLGIDKS